MSDRPVHKKATCTEPNIQEIPKTYYLTCPDGHNVGNQSWRAEGPILTEGAGCEYSLFGHHETGKCTWRLKVQGNNDIDYPWVWVKVDNVS